MEKVWVVQRQCGDYYCGCGGGHITGVFLSAEEAEAKAPRDKYGFGDSITEIPVGEFKWNADNSDDRAWS